MNLLSQRGDYEEALNLVDTALKRDGDGEGRLGELRKEIETRRTKSDG